MKKRVLCFTLLLCLFLPIVSAATYTVAKDGSGDYTSIQAASNVAQPGDTIYIRAGTYTETIRPARSGTAGKPITYAKSGSGDVIITGVNYGVNLDSRHYIVIDGLKIEDTYHWINLANSHHNIIKNCYLYGFGGWMGIWMMDSDHHKIFNNTLIAPCTGSEEAADLIYCRGLCEYNVIEDNYLEYGTHVTITIMGTEGISDYNVIRNNRIWNPWHTIISVWDLADHSLIEGNIILDAGEDYINNDCGQPGDRNKGRMPHAGIQIGSRNCIVRNNVMINNGWMEINSYPSGSNVPGAESLAYDNRIYHNTFHKNHYGPTSDTYEKVTGNVFKNNLLYKQVSYEFDMAVPDGINYYINNNILGASNYLGPGAVESGTLKLNPLFVNENAVSSTNNKNFKSEYVQLQSNSPMIDAGAFLTKTRSQGSGTSIPVEDASYFYDGWDIEGEVGDVIQLQGSTTTARITNVDYSSNTITVDRSLTWSTGTGVALAYNGNAPDIGAFEYGGSTPPPPPPTCTGDCKTSSCSNYDNCISASGTCSAGYYCCSGTCTETTPPTCSKCKTNPCNTYNNCISATGTCTTGMYCCSGTCTETTPPTCSKCKTSPCNTYDDCTTGAGTCNSGYYCCSGSCTTPAQTCSDGTAYNQCSTNKPLYCSNGNLINRCSTCKCLAGQECQADGTCQSTVPPGSNLALNAIVTTSNEDYGQAAHIVNGVNDEYNVYWAGTGSPNWVKVDLGQNHIINRIKVSPYGHASIYYYDDEWNIKYSTASSPNTWNDFTSVVKVSGAGDLSGSGISIINGDPGIQTSNDNYKYYEFTFNEVNARYILFTVTVGDRDGDSNGDEIEVYGSERQCIPGDMPLCDGEVDLFDLTFVITRFGTTPSDSNWDSAADTAQPKNIIDIFDVVFVASRIS